MCSCRAKARHATYTNRCTQLEKTKVQRTESVKKKKINELMELAFQIGEVRIFESYSEMEEEIVEIKNYQDYLNYFQKSINQKKKHISFGLHYKEAEGFLRIRRINLNPKSCDGKTFRYNIEGWGIIHIQLDLREERIECRIAVNTEKRAQKWESINPELKPSNLWNWKIVESKARKLIRELKKSN